jgi:hypothetical protein
MFMLFTFPLRAAASVLVATVGIAAAAGAVARSLPTDARVLPTREIVSTTASLDSAQATVPATANVSNTPIACKGASAARPAGEAIGSQLASATDVNYCWLECTPGSGCEYVCRHLMW